jgi:sec-independent protein translocase protein TatC
MMINSENIVKIAHWFIKLRKKLVASLFLVAVAACGVYFITDEIIALMSRPLDGESLFFITPAEGVLAKLELSVIGGLILVSPVIIYIFLSLAKAVLAKRTRRILYFLVIPLATLCFCGGIYFAYMLMLPETIHFFFKTSAGFMKPVISGKSYFSFVTFFLITVGVVFELPLVLVSLSRLGILTSGALRGKRKLVVAATFIGMVIFSSTPDIFSVAMITLPVIGLYEISIWWIFLLEKIDGWRGVQPCQ